MAKWKVGDKVVCKKDSNHYTGNYAGTDVEIISLDTSHHCTVLGYDGKKFLCPYDYLQGYDDFYNSYRKCECGAHKVYGKNCPAYFHHDYCPFYKPKE